MSQRRISDLLLSIVIAVGLWIYVIGVVNPPQTAVVKDIPVQVMGLDLLRSEGYTITDSGEYFIDVTITAPRSQVSSITEADISAAINLSGLSSGPNYVPVKVTAPDGVTVEDIRTPKLPVIIDDLITDIKPVHIVYGEKEGDYEVAVIMAETELVRVSGARELVERVAEIRYDLDVNALTYDISSTQRLAGILLDEEGNLIENVKLSNPQIYVTAALYPVKDVPLNVSWEGTPGLGAQLSKVDYPASIKVKGRSSLLRGLESLEAEVIDIEGITSDITVPLKYSLPEQVYLADDVAVPQATVKLVHQGEISFSYEPVDVIVTNVPDDCSGFMLDDVTVTVTAKGDLSIIRKLEAKDMQPLVDLSEIENGENEILLQSTFSHQGVSISIQPEHIRVQAKMPVPEPPEPEEGEAPEEGEDDPEGSTAENTDNKTEKE